MRHQGETTARLVSRRGYFYRSFWEIFIVRFE
jgi:hypothetical protein